MRFPKIVHIIFDHYRRFTNATVDPNCEATIHDGKHGLLWKTLSEAIGFKIRAVVYNTSCWRAADIGDVPYSIDKYNEWGWRYTFPHHVTGAFFVTKLPDLLPKRNSFTYPFQGSVWFGLLLLLLMLPLAFRLVVGRGRSLLQHFFDVLGNLANQGTDVTPSSTASTILYGTWWLCRCVFTLAYANVVLSFLSMPLREKGFRTFEELVWAILGDEIIPFTWRIDWMSFANVQSEMHRIIHNSLEKHLHRIMRGRNKGLNAYLDEGRTVWIAQDFEVDILTEKSNKMILESGMILFPQAFGIGYFKDAYFKDVIDKYIHRITAAGIYQKIKNHVEFKRSLKSRLDEEPDLSLMPLRLEDLSGVFLVLLVGWGIAFVVFLCEIQMKRFKNRTRREVVFNRQKSVAKRVDVKQNLTAPQPTWEKDPHPEVPLTPQENPELNLDYEV